MAKSGAYIGGNLGIGGMDTSSMNTSIYTSDSWNVFSDDLHGFSWNIHTGYLFGESNFQYGAELGYSQYADNKYRAAKTSTSEWEEFKYSGYNIDLLAVGKYNFNNGFNLFGKAGIARTTQKLKYSDDDGQNSKVTKHKVLPKIAMGVGYDLTENWEINAEYSHIFGSKPNAIGSDVDTLSQLNNKVASVNMLTLGVNYKF